MAACPTNSNRRALDDLRDSEGAATAVIALYLTPCERKVKMLRNLLHWATDGSTATPFRSKGAASKGPIATGPTRHTRRCVNIAQTFGITRANEERGVYLIG